MKKFYLLSIAFCLLNLLALAQDTSGIDIADIKLNCNVSSMEEVRSFYTDVLGANLVSPESKVPRDYIQFDNDQRINIIYMSDSEKVLTKEQAMNAPWVKIEVEDFDKRYKKVKKSGVSIIKENKEKRELYFQSPDGQVYRMVGKE